MHRAQSRRSPAALFGWALLCFGLAIQSAAAQEAQSRTTMQDSLDTLAAIDETIVEKRAVLAELQAKLDAASDGEEQERISAEISTLKGAIRQLETDFESVATGLDMEHFGAELDQRFALSEELEDLLRPIIQELKTATEDPRQIDKLRKDVAYHEERLGLAGQAIEHIKELQAATQDAKLLAALGAALEEWEKRKSQLANQVTVSHYQLEAKESQRKSLLESTHSLLGDFFRNRGLNMLMSLGAFLIVFFGLRLVYHRVQRIRPLKVRTFMSRLMTVVFFFFAFGAAVVAGLSVLYVAGDWVLLGLALIILFGLAWTTRQTLPHVLEDIRMLLNLGPVRENERLVFDGIPWHVVSLNVYTNLRNPSLTGGEIRLPVRTLSTLHSRPCSPDELWFPCRVDDWVLLGDGKRGRVVYQSPEFVQMVELGGARVTYPTADFLSLHPRNLSTDFRLSITFGIDYDHQPVCTTIVPERMEAALRAGLEAQTGKEAIRKVNVEFKEAGASSLDYAALVDFDGAVAAKYDELSRAIQRILVDTCNSEEWVIPFTQITIHSKYE